MSETKFTSGTWAIEYFSSGNKIRVYSEDLTKTLHENEKFFGVKLTQEEMANANLIAAAPDLYESCESALILLSKMGMESSDEYQAMLYATKKARGES